MSKSPNKPMRPALHRGCQASVTLPRHHIAWNAIPSGRALSAALYLLAAVLFLPGCGTTNSGGNKTAKAVFSASRVDELSLVTMPMAIGVNNQQGVDGIAIKVYASSRRAPKPQPIKEGILDVLMYDGIVQASQPANRPPRHQWTFSPSDLTRYTVTATIGTGYLLALSWGADQPQDDKITVIVRHTPAQGPPVYSAPSYISIPGPTPVNP